MIIVTGAEQGLGRAIMENSPSECECICLPRSVIKKGKMAIDEFIGDFTIHNKVEGLINNYGINHLSWIGSTPGCDEDIFHTNVLGYYWTVNALKKYNSFSPQKVINIASATYRVAQRTTTLYCASKAAVVQMTKVMARELSPYGWQVNCVAPGCIEDTDMNHMVNDQVVELRGWSEKEADLYAKKMIPVGRYSNTKEMAEVVWQMWGMPHYVNGAVLDAMGGV